MQGLGMKRDRDALREAAERLEKAITALYTALGGCDEAKPWPDVLAALSQVRAALDAAPRGADDADYGDNRGSAYLGGPPAGSAP